MTMVYLISDLVAINLSDMKLEAYGLSDGKVETHFV